MASWAEDIQAYQRKKQEAPATPAACVKSRKAKRPPAEYCIITQTFKDAGADERAREQESKSFVSAVNKAKVRPCASIAGHFNHGTNLGQGYQPVRPCGHR